MKEEHGDFFWSPQTLAWYKSAAAYGDYHAKLAGLLAPALDGCETVCDLGCGPGLLSLALLQHIPAITAFDRDPDALAILGQLGADRPGLHIRQGDAMHLAPQDSWDGLILSFFGQISVEDHLHYFMAHCNKRLICIVNTAVKSSFSSTGVSALKKEYADQVGAFLTGRGIPFVRMDAALEFGQPLEDLADARRFISRYSPPGCAVQDDAALESSLEKLPDGRWYLPHHKKIGIFVINKEDMRYEHLS